MYSFLADLTAAMSLLESSTFMLVLCFSSQAVQNQQQILYVKTANSSQCPKNVQIAHCQMLDWYSIYITTSTFHLHQTRKWCFKKEFIH